MITEIFITNKVNKIVHTLDKARPKQNSRKLALLKSISWRVIGSLDTMLISYFLTGDIKVALGISGIELITKITLFYLHERVWLKISKK